MRKRELVALLLLSSICLMTVSVLWFFSTMPWVGLQCVVVVLTDFLMHFSAIVTSLSYSHLLVTSEDSSGAANLCSIAKALMSRDTRFSTMWYVQPAKAHTSLRVSAV